MAMPGPDPIQAELDDFVRAYEEAYARDGLDVLHDRVAPAWALEEAGQNQDRGLLEAPEVHLISRWPSHPYTIYRGRMYVKRRSGARRS